ncbi:TonB-dependent receptor [Massilia sp. H6]|uniref:TonB-dependent receptor family protein n=1 Tax=Massilia sp. H6 TaxID=2970464 RepID=UPI002168E8AC|nr:TonB-dependent receptor [Massilia sp. H6]UVW29337.1 TonB-dependent receptor [Massilia sp. H6]
MSLPRPHVPFVAGLLVSFACPAFAQSPAAPQSVVVVTGSRTEQESFDLPAAVSVVDAQRIGAGQPRVNLSESLVTVPGIVVQNRQNYAQDLQVSSRGFGARSSFGVRGVRLIADGIPATMPDGQGQAATFNLDMAERIEVLRGPFSALYGNHSGGVIQLFTRDGEGAPAVEMSTTAGSDGLRKTDVNAQGKAGAVGYVIDASRFETDGYRDHSAATRDQGYAKLTMATNRDGKLTIVANSLDQDDTQDPLGATWQTFKRDPRAGEIDTTDTQTPQRTFAERYNTRKSIDHRQLGLNWQQRFGPHRLQVTAYGGNRRVIQFQSFSRGFQQQPTHSGGVIDFDRDFRGVDVNWQDVRTLGSGMLRTTFGLEYADSEDARQGFENFDSTGPGVKGRLRRDENNRLTSMDPYVQTQWESGAWVLTGGLRHTRLKIGVNDRFVANGDDSGGTSFDGTAPVIGVLRKISPSLNVYASAARGFETPTLNELFYSASGAGFNFGLSPSRSVHLEVGAKSMFGAQTRADIALFQASTRDELVVAVSNGGRTSYRNAARTLRQGMELSVASTFGAGWNVQVAANLLRAIYDDGFGTIPRGNRLPGVPRASVFSELGWATRDGNINAALEAQASSKVHPDDANAAVPAPGYGVLNARLQARQQAGRWHFKEYLRLNNLLDRDIVGSVIVAEANRRYYEAAPGRNWMLGFSARYQFQ